MVKWKTFVSKSKKVACIESETIRRCVEKLLFSWYGIDASVVCFADDGMEYTFVVSDPRIGCEDLFRAIDTVRLPNPDAEWGRVLRGLD